MPYATPYIHKEIVAQAVSAAAVFFVTLVVVSLFTVRLSDAILDSKIGALDRSLGFLFGAARGFLLGVVAFSIFNWLVAEKQQPDWVKTAKTRPALVDTANWIIALLPEDAAATIEGWIKAKNASAAGEPPDESDAAAVNPAASPTPTSTPAKKPDAAAPAAGASSADKQKLDSLIGKGAATPTPTPTPISPAIGQTPLKH
jgi:membrane protein required for colicin V production